MLSPEAQQAKDAHRDAAAMILAIMRGDVQMMKAIQEAADPDDFSAGAFSIAALLTYDSYGDESISYLEEFIGKLSDSPDEFWESMANTRTAL